MKINGMENVGAEEQRGGESLPRCPQEEQRGGELLPRSPQVSTVETVSGWAPSPTELKDLCGTATG
eukprot:15867709-Heterocapsa_arctica.AAC.1